MPCSDGTFVSLSVSCYTAKCPRYSDSIATWVGSPKSCVADGFARPSDLTLDIFGFICETCYYWLSVIPGLPDDGVDLLYEWGNFALGCDCAGDDYCWLLVCLIFNLDHNSQHISHTSNKLTIICPLNRVNSRSKRGTRPYRPLKANLPCNIYYDCPRRNWKCWKLVCIEYRR